MSPEIEDYQKAIADCEKRITDKVDRFVSNKLPKKSFCNNVKWDIEKRRVLKEILEEKRNE